MEGWIGIPNSRNPEQFSKCYAFLNGIHFTIALDNTFQVILYQIFISNDLTLTRKSNVEFTINIPSQKPYLIRTSNEREMEKWLQSFANASPEKEEMNIDHFNILSEIGHGSYGIVYLAQEQSSNKLYAIKAYSKEKGQKHAIHEIDIMINLRHPFLIHLKYYFETESTIYLVLNYASGGDLLEYLKTNPNLLITDIRLYMGELILGIEELHRRGIIMRDLKLENILINEDGHLIITDFGLSKQMHKKKLTRTFCGTPEYLAPEIIQKQPYGTKVDVWNLGIVMYYLCFKTHPFHGTNELQIYETILTKEPTFPPNTDQNIIELIRLMLIKEPSLRPSISELKDTSFFSEINWDAISSKSISPSYIPLHESTSFDLKKPNELIYNEELFSLDTTYNSLESLSFSFGSQNWDIDGIHLINY